MPVPDLTAAECRMTKTHDEWQNPLPGHRSSLAVMSGTCGICGCSRWSESHRPADAAPAVTVRKYPCLPGLAFAEALTFPDGSPVSRSPRPCLTDRCVLLVGGASPTGYGRVPGGTLASAAVEFLTRCTNSWRIPCAHASWWEVLRSNWRIMTTHCVACSSSCRCRNPLPKLGSGLHPWATEKS